MAYFSKHFIFDTDESAGFGADLSHNIDGCHQPVAYVPKTWSNQAKEGFLNL
jgi:hypothetical protein